MKKLFFSFLLLLPFVASTSVYAEDIPNNEIWYTLKDNPSGVVLSPNTYYLPSMWTWSGKGKYITNPFNVTIVKNEYKDGKGVITLSGDLTSISDYSFAISNTSNGGSHNTNASLLTSISFPSSLKNIGADVFYKCTNLASVTIGDSVTNIGNSAFYGCSSLTSINIPNSVTSLGDNAFSSCSSLTEVSIPSSVINFGSYVFSYCQNLTNVVLGDSLQCIGKYAFQNCSSLSAIVIPNSVKTIGEYAFSQCTSLSVVKMPQSGTTVGSYTFSDCTSLPIEGNIRYADTYLVGATDKTLSTYSIKEGTKWIGNGAFSSCYKLTSITIPTTVISIEDFAFEECWELSSIVIPNAVKTIGNGAFRHCCHLGEVTIGQSVTSIGFQAFYNIYDTTIRYTSQHTLIRNLSLIPQTTGDEAFRFTYCTLLVYQGLKSAYQNSGYWDAMYNIYDNLPLTKATSIKLDKATYHSNKDEMFNVSVILPTETTIKNVEWVISDSTIVAIVDEVAGTFIALKEGIATITAKTIDGSDLSTTAAICVGNNFIYTDKNGYSNGLYYSSGNDVTIEDTYKDLLIKNQISSVNLTYTRNFSDAMVGNWQAWYMPCDFDYDDLSEDFDVAEIAGVLFDKDGQNYVAFRKMTEGTVKAHTPYVVRAKDAGDVAITTTTTLQPTDVTKTHTIQSSYNNFTFGGVYENSYLSAEQPTYALNKSGNFALMSESVYLRPFRIYMRITDREDNPYAAVTAPQEVKVVVLGEDETSIDEIHNSQFIIHNDESSEIYNLGGQKLQKLQKGINIVNGRKVLF